MTTQASTGASTGLPRAFEVARAWLASGRHQAMAALALYVAISVGYFGLHVCRTSVAQTSDSAIGAIRR